MVNNIYLKVIPLDQDRLKVTWKDDVNIGYGPYYLARQQVKETVGKIRKELEALTNEYLYNPDPQYSPIMRKLAKEGNTLNFLLFEGAAGQESVDKAQKVKRWLNGLEGTIRLNISVSSSVHIPWTLVFDEDPELIPDGTINIDDYQGFWGQKYSISVLFSGMSPKELKNPRKRSTFKVISALNNVEYKNAFSNLKEKEIQYLNSLLDRPLGKTFEWSACKKQWEKLGQEDCLLNIFSHATGKELELSDKDCLNVIKFRQLFRRENLNESDKECYCFMFLNGCSTAVGDLDNSFINATSEQPGFCGFVGAEASLPAEFAIRFGGAFLSQVLDGGTTVQLALKGLHRQHWPLSILYNSYAHPYFHIEKDKNVSPTPWSDEVNFSYPLSVK